MKQNQAEILYKLFRDGYIIQIDHKNFLISNVTDIKIINTDDLDCPSEYAYSDNNIFNEWLGNVNISRVKVFARVDWAEKIHKDDRVVVTAGIAIHDTLTALNHWNYKLDKAYKS